MVGMTDQYIKTWENSPSSNKVKNEEMKKNPKNCTLKSKLRRMIIDYYCLQNPDLISFNFFNKKFFMTFKSELIYLAFCIIIIYYKIK